MNTITRFMVFLRRTFGNCPKFFWYSLSIICNLSEINILENCRNFFIKKKLSKFKQLSIETLLETKKKKKRACQKLVVNFCFFNKLLYFFPLSRTGRRLELQIKGKLNKRKEKGIFNPTKIQVEKNEKGRSKTGYNQEEKTITIDNF